MDHPNAKSSPRAPLHLTAEASAAITRIGSSTIEAFCSVVNDPAAVMFKDEVESLNSRPLKGLPFAVKEVIDVAGFPCSYGCKAFEDRRPTENAVIVNQLISLGALVVGITRSTEMAIAKPTVTMNPWSPAHSPGGSSSGSAAAVGAGLVPFALGTQTIGSTIRPAAYCGAVGFKPSKGLGSLHGVLPLSPTLDHLGFFADSLERMTEVFTLLTNNRREASTNSFRLMFVKPWFQSDGLESFFRLRERLRPTKFESTELTLPALFTREEANITETILGFEMFRTWGDSLLGHAGTSDSLQRLLLHGKSLTEPDYQQSLDLRQAMIDHLDKTFGERDIIIFPSVMGLPPRLEQGTGSRAPQRLWTLLGMPALNLPVGQHGGFPLNLQLIAKRGADHHLLESAKAINQLLTGRSKPVPRP